MPFGEPTQRGRTATSPSGQASPPSAHTPSGLRAPSDLGRSGPASWTTPIAEINIAIYSMAQYLGSSNMFLLVSHQWKTVYMSFIVYQKKYNEKCVFITSSKTSCSLIWYL